MPSSAKQMPAEANAAVPRVNPAEVREIIAKGNSLIVPSAMPLAPVSAGPAPSQS